MSSLFKNIEDLSLEEQNLYIGVTIYLFVILNILWIISICISIYKVHKKRKFYKPSSFLIMLKYRRHNLDLYTSIGSGFLNVLMIISWPCVILIYLSYNLYIYF